MASSTTNSELTKEEAGMVLSTQVTPDSLDSLMICV